METKNILKEVGFRLCNKDEAKEIEALLGHSTEGKFSPAGKFTLTFQIGFVDAEQQAKGFCVSGGKTAKSMHDIAETYFPESNLTESRADDDNYPPVHLYSTSKGKVRKKFSEPMVGTELCVNGYCTYYLGKSELAKILDEEFGFRNT